jgi:hypothetical protein
MMDGRLAPPGAAGSQEATRLSLTAAMASPTDIVPREATDDHSDYSEGSWEPVRHYSDGLLAAKAGWRARDDRNRGEIRAYNSVRKHDPLAITSAVQLDVL